MNKTPCTIFLLTLLFHPVFCNSKTTPRKQNHTPVDYKSVLPTINVNNSNNSTLDNPKQTSLQPVELSVKSNKATTQFSYLKADKHALFTANTGYGFSAVKTKSGSSCSGSLETIWEADQNDEWAIKVIRDGAGACSSTKNVTIFYPKSNYRHFTKVKKKWCLMLDIGLYKCSGDQSEVLDDSEYTLDYDGNDRFYSFNEATQCCEITYFHRRQDATKSTIAVTEEKTVWKLDAKKDKKYPKSLKFFWQNKMILNFGDTFIVSDKLSDGSWNTTEINIKIYSLDPNTNNLVEMDTKQYELLRYGKDCEFKFEADFKCDLIKYLGNELWKYDASKEGDKHPLSVFYRDSLVLINFTNSFLVYQKRGDDGWDELRLDIKMFGKLVSSSGGATASGASTATSTANPAVPEVELNLSNYDLEKLGDEFYFTLRDNVQCLQIKLPGTELWKHDAAKYGDKYPTFVRYNEAKTKLVVNFEHMVLFYQRNKDLVLDQATELTIKLYGPKTTDSSENNESNAGTVEELRKYTIYDEPDDFEFKTAQDEKCTLIRVAGQDVWQHDAAKDADKYPDLIAYKKDGSRLIAYFDGYFIVCTRADDGKWSSKRSINLDISKQETTEHYTYSEHRYYNTFIGKADVFFKKVTLGGSTIYESEDANHSVSRVVIYKAQGDVVNDVTVFLINGTIQRFNKIDDSERWYQRLTPLSLDIKRKLESYYYECYRRRGLVTFVSKNNFGFRRVRYGMKLVWESKHDTAYGAKVEVDEHNGSSDVRIYLYNGETRFFKIKNVPFTEATSEVLGSLSTTKATPSEANLSSQDFKPAIPASPKKLGGQAAAPKREAENESDSSDPKAFDLDIEKRETTEKYSCTHEDSNRLNRFECKADHKIKKVLKGTHVLWEKRGAKYAVQVDIYYMSDQKPKTNEDAQMGVDQSSSGTGDGSGSPAATNPEEATNTQVANQNDRKLAIVVYLDNQGERKQMYLKPNPNAVGYEQSKPVTVANESEGSTHTSGSEGTDGTKSGDSSGASSGTAGTQDSGQSSTKATSDQDGSSQ